MKTHHTELSEFHRQLALLVRADLPLPESLRNLARKSNEPRFQAALESVSEATARGVPLAEAMGRHREFFAPLHVRLIEAGEKSGTLAEALQEVAEIARLDASLTGQVRDVATYPVFVILFALGVLLFMFRFVVHDMAAIARDFGLGGSALPRLSLLVYRIADGVTAGWGPALSVYLIAVVAAIWYFLGLAWPGHGPRRTPRFLPGLAGVTANHDAARLCAVWSVLARRGVPLDRIIETVAEMMEDHTVAADLRRLGALAAAGTPLAKGLESVHAVPESVAMVLTYAPEPDVAARLVSLKQLYIEAMSLAARRAMVLWHTLTFFGMALVAGGVVLALFLPLIHLIRCLAG